MSIHAFRSFLNVNVCRLCYVLGWFIVVVFPNALPITSLQKKNLFIDSSRVDSLCRSFISAPLWCLSSRVWPCEGVKGQVGRLAGHLCTFLKALKDAQHVYPLRTNNKGRGCVTKGHQHGRDGAQQTAGDEWKCVRVRLCLCVRQLNPISRHWTNKSILELLDATNSIYSISTSDWAASTKINLIWDYFWSDFKLSRALLHN